ncbi:unnamed protein product [Chrysoparadoxa australica]
MSSHGPFWIPLVVCLLLQLSRSSGWVIMNSVPSQSSASPTQFAAASPVEVLSIRGRKFLVKRDDKLRLLRSSVPGNKARKLHGLNAMSDEEFPDLVVSFGGPQSNAMIALAAIVASKGSRLKYYTKKIPRWLSRNPSGNLARALALQTEIIEVHPKDYADVFGGPDGPLHPGASICPPGAYWIPQGGAAAGAEDGVKMLADEIIDYWSTSESEWPGKSLTVVVPSGTGTTALFLARHLQPHGIEVVAIPCIGDDAYLRRQMERLDRDANAKGVFPKILKPLKKEKFGAPRRELLEIWRALRQAKLFVDLLYGARAWEVLLEPAALADLWGDEGRVCMYYHSGGLEGVSTQLTRYKHTGLVDAKELQ